MSSVVKVNSEGLTTTSSDGFLVPLFPADIYVFKVTNGNNRTLCGLCLKLTIKTPGVFIVNFEQISLIVLAFPWVTWNN